MKIWIVNPFDPLPGDPEQGGRYAALALLLSERGHEVTWWTSSYSHRFKRPVDQAAITAACQHLDIAVRFLHGPPYRRNVGVMRILNHSAIARDFSKRASRETVTPDVVVASSPPLSLAKQAIERARLSDARAILDVQDPWPETFYRLVPGWVRPALSLALAPLEHLAVSNSRNADVIVGVADKYVQQSLERSRADTPSATIPLGLDLRRFRTAARNGYSEEFTKPDAETWCVYSGSLNRSYDLLTVVRAFGRLRQTSGPGYKLFITGVGELRDAIQNVIDQEQLKDVTLTGFLTFDRLAYLLTQSDIGFNSTVPGAGIYLPNKIFYYLAAGLAVVNGIPGQCSEIVRSGKCGLDYEPGDEAGCFRSLQRLVGNREDLRSMQENARNLAQQYDRPVLYERYVRLIEQLG